MKMRNCKHVERTTLMSLKMNRQRDGNCNVEEGGKRVHKHSDVARLSWPKIRGNWHREVVCGLIIDLMDGGMERRMMWVRAAADQRGVVCVMLARACTELSRRFQNVRVFCLFVGECISVCVCVCRLASWSRYTGRQPV